MHVRCDNQYKTGAERGNILGQPMLFEYMGICILRPEQESELGVTLFMRWLKNTYLTDFV